MSMTRRHFIMLAEALCDARVDATGDPVDHGIDLAALYIADALGKDNPRFERQRFLRAAGVTWPEPDRPARPSYDDDTPGLARKQV